MLPNKRNVPQRRNLIAYSNPDSIISEQFREIRTNIRFLTQKAKKKPILMITSPGSGEGKSTLAANLAVSMAQQKEKVLVIDANLREPSLHTIFKSPNSTGLTDVITGKSTFEEAVYQTEIGRLGLLPSGTIPSNPTELVGTEMMNDILKESLREYDVVLIDSPGVLEVADTKILANKCDGVILVVGEGKTEYAKAVETKKALAFAQAQLLGVIVNVIK
ncbi:CpsD/CapB family tyrosine-protein kinase [Mesobacillus foraminis]